MTDQSKAELAGSVGELKGLLIGIQMMMAENNTALNRRIDDMHNSNTRRLDDLEKSIGVRLTEQAQDLAAVRKTAEDAKEIAVANRERIDAVSGRATKTSVATGAGAAALIEAGIAIAKVAIGSGIGPG